MNFLQIDEIYSFKLVTGEEVVAKVLINNTDSLEVKTPILMMLGPQGLQMMPAMFGGNAEKNVHINTSNIVMVADAREDIRNKYIEITTGIAPVTKSIITG